MLLLLLLGLRSHLALSLHIGRVIPETANNVSRNSESQRTFIGQEVRRDPHMFPNHAAWHLRHANEVPYNPPAAASPNTTVFESSMTYTTQLTASASTAATGSDASQLASLLHSTEDLVTDSSLDWDQQTESACNIALTSLGGKATSPSGIATCYNIGNLDRSTGIFHVDLRLYRIAACNGDWIQLQTSTPDISLSYAGASLLANTIQKARWDGDRLDWSIAEREEAKDMYLRRSNSASPKKLEDLSFVGTVHNDKLAELSNMSFRRISSRRAWFADNHLQNHCTSTLNT